MEVVEYFAPGYEDIEDVKSRHSIYDATTLQKIADCPRKYEVRAELGLEPARDASPKMIAGIAIHAALEYYYSFSVRGKAQEEMARAVARSEWDSFAIDRALMDENAVHLSAEHIDGVLRNYFHTWNVERIDIYEPATYFLQDLILDDVIAAKWRVNEAGYVVLGESKLIMKFDVDGEEFVYSGIPDLPVTKQNGSLWAMDHKSTSSYLSDWWAKSFEVSNQLRGYMAMIRSLTGTIPEGGVINAIHVGKNALNPNSKAAKFERYQFDFAPDHIDESLRNQLAWVKTIEHYRSTGYWPQGCGYGGCDMPGLCRRDPETRIEVLATEYQPSTRNFWNL